jgi:hypothetical protein
MSKVDECVMRQVGGLNHPELKCLYEFAEEISSELIEQILLLPRETLIADLVHILEGAEDYHSSVKSQYGEIHKIPFDEDFDYGFQCIHSLFILGEIGANEALPAVVGYIEKLPLLDYMYSDCVTEYVWMYFHGIYAEKKQDLEALLCDESFGETLRIAVSSGIGSWYIFHPEHREESLLFWERVSLKLAENLDSDSSLDGELLSYVACNIIDAKLKELLPLLESLDERGYLQTNVIGDIDSIKEDLLDDGPARPEMPLLTIYEIYEELGDLDAFNDIDLFDEDESSDSSIPLLEPVRSEPKIGRNDPCICGSGKKYKKCCMAD